MRASPDLASANTNRPSPVVETADTTVGTGPPTDCVTCHEALEKAGLAPTEETKDLEPLMPYHLRHSALTRLADNSPNPFAVQAAAGHESIITTQRCVHPQEAEIWAASEKKSGHKIGHSARLRKLKVVGNDGGEAE